MVVGLSLDTLIEFIRVFLKPPPNPIPVLASPDRRTFGDHLRGYDRLPDLRCQRPHKLDPADTQTPTVHPVDRHQ